MRACSKRTLGLGLMAAVGLASVSPSQAHAASPKAASFELTFLKASEGNVASLCQFIKENWFEMDRIAVERGLMTDYRLLSSDGTDADWDVLVMVGYPNPDGYAGITKEFDAIRAAHTIVPVNGKTLRQLGTIVASRRLVPG
ncbi:hypothetical protein [Aquidulcibacter sp.]|uniref:hypothetical protein n=1 Tax=Aquidulcibacter sp. TaxID=2052990 RepID=UPI0025BB43B2|nr:hypothetical protein [Aquidulcibacter sp.]MCA3691929.1 hypothetical protein [Aquidulcibacter sp.]